MLVHGPGRDARSWPTHKALWTFNQITVPRKPALPGPQDAMPEPRGRPRCEGICEALF